MIPEVLSQIPGRDLSRAIGSARLRSIAAVVHREVDENDSVQLSQLAFALLGFSLFDNPRVRRLALETLDDRTLAQLADRFAQTAFPKAADNALALSRVAWSPGSAFVREFGRLLKIPSDFLPRRGIAQPSLETVSPPPPVTELRPYQVDVVRRVQSCLAGEAARLLVQMPTGAGKTRTLVEALHSARLASPILEEEPPRPFTVWVAHTEELCEQALRTFRAVWGARAEDSVTLVRFWGSHRVPLEALDRAVVFSTYQKLVAAARAAAPEFEVIARGPLFLVVDEAHKVLAASFKRVVETIQQAEGTTLIGLTATPGRGFERGQENSRLAAFFDKNLIEPAESSAGLLEDLRSAGVLAQIRHSEIRSEEVVRLSAEEVRDSTERFDLSPRVLARIAASVPRNSAIVQEVVSQVEKGRRALLFACSVEHSRLLVAALQLEGCPAAHLDATVSGHVRRTLLQKFSSGECAVLSNFEVLATGFDVPKVDVVVLARPTTSLVLYSQMVGRGLRGPASGGSPECHLVDVRDNFATFGEIDRVYKTFSPYWR